MFEGFKGMLMAQLSMKRLEGVCDEFFRFHSPWHFSRGGDEPCLHIGDPLKGGRKYVGVGGSERGVLRKRVDDAT